MASTGSFTTEDLMGWFKSVAPSSAVPRKPNILSIPPPGAVEYQFVRQQQESARREQEREDHQNGFAEEAEATSYVPDYNTAPDDEKAFDYVEEYDVGPGNPTSPNAQPGDHDYAVNQSTDVYEEFTFHMDRNPALPIHKFKEEILLAIESGQVGLFINILWLSNLPQSPV